MMYCLCLYGCLFPYISLLFLVYFNIGWFSGTWRHLVEGLQEKVIFCNGILTVKHCTIWNQTLILAELLIVIRIIRVSILEHFRQHVISSVSPYSHPVFLIWFLSFHSTDAHSADLPRRSYHTACPLQCAHFRTHPTSSHSPHHALFLYFLSLVQLSNLLIWT